MSDESLRQIIEVDMRRQRSYVLTRRVLDVLRSTIRVWGMTPETPVKDVRAEFTDESIRAIAPLCEAVEILEAIIWASDGCRGHRDCLHTMEPWKRARALLEGKWEVDANGGHWPFGAKKTGVSADAD